MARLVSDVPRPAPEPRPAPALDVNALAQALASAIRDVKIPAPQVTVQAATAPQVKVVPQTPTLKWKFTVARDKAGYISEITAIAN